MIRFLKIQSLFYFDHIYKRFGVFVILLFFMEIFLTIQFKDNPNFILFEFIFEGVSKEEIVTHHPHLAIYWLIYFIIPIFIQLDSLHQIWNQRVMILKARGYSVSQFARINVVLMVITALGYYLLTMISFWIAASCSHHIISLKYNIIFQNILLNLIICILIYQLFCLFKSYFGHIALLAYLVITNYLIIPYNPLNNTMLVRIENNQIVSELFIITALIIIYHYCYQRRDFI